MSLFRRADRARPGAAKPALGTADRATLDHLARAGADLAEPRHVVYYCYAPSLAAGRAMADAAQAHGFRVEVRDPLPAYPGQWAVVAETVAVADPAFIARTAAFFDQLAAAHGAEYDGWEAAV